MRPSLITAITVIVTSALMDLMPMSTTNTNYLLVRWAIFGLAGFLVVELLSQ